MNRYALYSVVALAVVALTVVVAFIVEPYFLSQTASQGGPGALAGRSAPVFDLRDDTGRAVSLNSYRGSIVVMNLWASWCPPCRAEMPDLQRLAEAYGRNGVVVVGVNEGESAQRARAFADSLGIRFPIWVDAGQRYGRTYAALGLPTTVIVNRRGVVFRGYDGALTFEQMRAAVKAAAQAG